MDVSRAPAATPREPVSVLIAAVGGQGGGVLTGWIVDAAHRDGLVAQATSSPGVSQRSGATTYYVEIAPPARPGGTPRTLGLMPVPGRVDVLLCAELLEAARMLERGYATPSRTTVIASTHRVYTTIEKTSGADGRVDGERIVAAIRALAKRALLADLDAIARDHAAAISAAAFGALAGSGAVPLTPGACEAAIRAAGKGADESVAAFADAFDLAAGERAAPVEAARAARAEGFPLPAGLEDRVRGWPAPLAEVARLGGARLSDYQDERYAALYLDRVGRLARIDAAVATVAARELARWMGYEDAIRVAAIKARRSRLDRIRAEASAGPDDVVRVREIFAPGPDEVAAVMPRPIGDWIERRARGGRGSRLHWTVETTSPAGALALRCVAGLRRWRPRSLRYAREQAAIDAWLDALEHTLARPGGREAALALAALPALRRGYGDAHARGLSRYDAILASFMARVDADPGGAAAALERERDAALADPGSVAGGLEGAPAQPSLP
ncbi:MAG: indolepyruvate oxidoreductase subunit beta family protein [Burkholderiales bacterium]